jgi:hypothetical protein
MLDAHIDSESKKNTEASRERPSEGVAWTSARALVESTTTTTIGTAR